MHITHIVARTFAENAEIIKGWLDVSADGTSASEAIQISFWGGGKMSRLYSWIESDTGRAGKQTKTITGRERITVTVNYGSAHNSERCCYLHVSFPKGAEKPTIYFSEAELE